MLERRLVSAEPRSAPCSPRQTCSACHGAGGVPDGRPGPAPPPWFSAFAPASSSRWYRSPPPPPPRRAPPPPPPPPRAPPRCFRPGRAHPPRT
eukprot:scaffold2011_cov233-Pinguiococcus_pyrenoidosus.AAC.12